MRFCSAYSFASNSRKSVHSAFIFIRVHSCPSMVEKFRENSCPIAVKIYSSSVQERHHRLPLRQETTMTLNWIAKALNMGRRVRWRTCCAKRNQIKNMRLCGTGPFNYVNRESGRVSGTGDGSGKRLDGLLISFVPLGL